LKVKLSEPSSHRTIAGMGEGNKILAVFEANDFSHSLGLERHIRLGEGDITYLPYS
jgi:hypothetical protein